MFGLFNFQNGFKARLVKIENCGGDDQVLKIDPNVTLSLTSDCDVVIAGCAETSGFATATVTIVLLKKSDWMSKDFECFSWRKSIVQQLTSIDIVIESDHAYINAIAMSQQIKYTILKNGNRITSGTTDLCAELKKEAKGLTTALVSFGLPKECPIPKVLSLNLISYYERWSWRSLYLVNFHFQLRKCADGSEKISIAKQKSFLSLVAGNIDLSVEGTHDNVSEELIPIFNQKLMCIVKFKLILGEKNVLACCT